MYQDLSNIDDRAEFGIAIIKWWNAMQPVFCQSPKGMLQLLYTPPPSEATNPWAPLQRAGPNGLLSVMTLLCWWGRLLSTKTVWQEDSSSLWKAVVDDVIHTLQALKETSGSCGKKRKMVDAPGTIPGKR